MITQVMKVVNQFMQVDEKGTVLKPRQSAEDNLATLLAALSGTGSCQTNTQGGRAGE
jgi:hypothetical protein